jgi:23S rRNA (cytosine1962-C5)-methyltransferase
LLHSERDGLPGLIVDQFDNVLSVQINSAGMEKLIDLILPLLQKKTSAKSIVLRNDTSLRNLEGLAKYTKVWQSEDTNVTA